MSEREPKQDPRRDNDELADALNALHDEETDGDGELLADGFELDTSARPLRPLTPGDAPPPRDRLANLAQNHPADAPLESETEIADAMPGSLTAPQPSDDVANFDRIVDNDVVNVPAPSAEMLAATSGRRTGRAPARRSEPRSVSIQRTIIPILLTLGLLLPALAVWVITLPAESETRSSIPSLHVYLFAAGVVFLLIAILNMFQVRSRLKHIASGA